MVYALPFTVSIADMYFALKCLAYTLWLMVENNDRLYHLCLLAAPANIHTSLSVIVKPEVFFFFFCVCFGLLGTGKYILFSPY